jgi:hypothetical protein
MGLGRACFSRVRNVDDESQTQRFHGQSLERELRQRTLRGSASKFSKLRRRIDDHDVEIQSGKLRSQSDIAVRPVLPSNWMNKPQLPRPLELLLTRAA